MPPEPSDSYKQLLITSEWGHPGMWKYGTVEKFHAIFFHIFRPRFRINTNPSLELAVILDKKENAILTRYSYTRLFIQNLSPHIDLHSFLRNLIF